MAIFRNFILWFMQYRVNVDFHVLYQILLTKRRPILTRRLFGFSFPRSAERRNLANEFQEPPRKILYLFEIVTFNL